MWYENFYTYEKYSLEFPLSSGKSRDKIFVLGLINRALNDVNSLSNGVFKKSIETNTLTDDQKDYIYEAIGRIVFGYELNEFNFNDLTLSLGQGGVSQSLTVSQKNAQILDHILNQLRLAGLLTNYKYLGESDKPNEIYEGGLKEANENQVATFGDIKRMSLLLNGTNNPTNAIDFAGKELRNAKLVNPSGEFTVSKALKADKILDPGTGNYETIRDVTDLAFFGNDRDNALTRAQVQNLVLAGNLIWSPEIPYLKGTVVEFISASGELGNAIAKRDNIGNDPKLDGPDYLNWDIRNVVIDIDTVKNQVLDEVEPLLPGVVNEELNKLPTIDYVSEFKEPIFSFNNNSDFDNYKAATGTTDLDWENVNSDYYTINETNNLLNEKQDTLTAGTGIEINNNVISSSGGEWEQVNSFSHNSTVGILQVTGDYNEYLISGKFRFNLGWTITFSPCYLVRNLNLNYWLTYFNPVAPGNHPELKISWSPNYLNISGGIGDKLNEIAEIKILGKR